MKKTTKILGIIVVLLSLTIFLLIDSFFVAPTRFTKRTESISSEKIPEQLDEMKILFFSDLKYGIFMDEDRLNKLVDTINNSGADVVIFGGDIYGDDITVTDEINNAIITAFSNIKAKYGKFAVYGDIDDSSDVMKTAVNTIYDSSNFEVIQNTSFQIHKNGSQFITLVGIDNGIDGIQDISGAYANVSQNSYVFTICHTPDTANQVPTDLTDYFLAGHSLGGQVNFLFSSLYEPACATQYLRGTHTIDDKFTLDITNGTGTVKQDVRFLEPAEVVVYTLKNIKKEEEQTPSSTLETTSTNEDSTSESQDTTTDETTDDQSSTDTTETEEQSTDGTTDESSTEEQQPQE